jgi:hypothetical protein
MARAVEQIERDIAALEETVRAIAAELHSAYTSYLTALGQAVQQQLILASYHLCTQGYPESFLGLSFNQRQQLQQAIRKLGQNAAEQLIASTKIEETEDRNQEPEEILDLTQNSKLNGQPEEAFQSALVSKLKPQNSPHPSSPRSLAQWQQNLEQAIANTLKTLSRETNRLLQQAGILPKSLPAPVLEAAVNASEGVAEAMPGPPNLLNLLIESENNQESGDSSVTHIIAINLRLAEIEFADATVRAGRNQIRNLEGRVRSLGREYLKKQRERAVAEAEAAWRASWFDG